MSGGDQVGGPALGVTGQQPQAGGVSRRLLSSGPGGPVSPPGTDSLPRPRPLPRPLPWSPGTGDCLWLCVKDLELRIEETLSVWFHSIIVRDKHTKPTPAPQDQTGRSLSIAPRRPRAPGAQQHGLGLAHQRLPRSVPPGSPQQTLGQIWLLETVLSLAFLLSIVHISGSSNKT